MSSVTSRRGFGPLGWLLGGMAVLLICALGLPITTYVLGKRVIGPYEGKYGLTDYLGSIYAGAGAGEPAAWVLLSAPLLVAAVWLWVAWMWRR